MPVHQARAAETKASPRSHTACPVGEHSVFTVISELHGSRVVLILLNWGISATQAKRAEQPALLEAGPEH